MSVLGIFGTLGITDALDIFGTRYDKSFDEDFPKGIRFGMSEKEIAQVEGYNYEKSGGDGETYTHMHYKEFYKDWTFTLSHNKLTFVFLAMPKEYAWDILEKYGEADEETDTGYYYWYGMVGDTKCVLGFEWTINGPGITFEAR